VAWTFLSAQAAQVENLRDASGKMPELRSTKAALPRTSTLQQMGLAEVTVTKFFYDLTIHDLTV